MDPITIFGAVTGGVAAASEIAKALDAAISTGSKAKAAPKIAASTLRDVQMIQRNLLRFETLQNGRLAAASDRLSYIPLEATKNTFLDCVASLDQLEDVIKPLADPSLDQLSMTERLQWAMKDKKIGELSQRVHNTQNSLGLMLTILQTESLLEVHKAVEDLIEVTKQIAKDVAHLNARQSIVSHAPRPALVVNDDTSTIRTSVIRLDSVSAGPEAAFIRSWDAMESEQEQQHTEAASRGFNPRFAFEHDLQSSRPYRRASQWSREDISFRSSVPNPRALSYISKLSLGDVSSLSVVALPISLDDLSNNKHYMSGQTKAAAAAAVAEVEASSTAIAPPTAASPSNTLPIMFPPAEQGEVEPRQRVLSLLQVGPAAKLGFLHSFRCKTCNRTLASIFKGTIFQPSVPFQLWYRKPGRDGRPLAGEEEEMEELPVPCKCYTELCVGGSPETYYGCRALGSRELRCARCFDLCSGCAATSTRTKSDGAPAAAAAAGSPKVGPDGAFVVEWPYHDVIDLDDVNDAGSGSSSVVWSFAYGWTFTASDFLNLPLQTSRPPVPAGHRIVFTGGTTADRLYRRQGAIIDGLMYGLASCAEPDGIVSVPPGSWGVPTVGAQVEALREAHQLRGRIAALETSRAGQLATVRAAAVAAGDELAWLHMAPDLAATEVYDPSWTAMAAEASRSRLEQMEAAQGALRRRLSIITALDGLEVEGLELVTDGQLEVLGQRQEVCRRLLSLMMARRDMRRLALASSGSDLGGNASARPWPWLPSNVLWEMEMILFKKSVEKWNVLEARVETFI